MPLGAQSSASVACFNAGSGISATLTNNSLRAESRWLTWRYAAMEWPGQVPVCALT